MTRLNYSKLLLTLLLALGASSSFAQTPIFFEDFSAGMPPSFLVIDNDGLTPDPNVAPLVPAGWGINDPIAGDSAAVSTSWYAPAGQSDDWLITPSISVPATGDYILKWDALAPDAAFPDGYEIYVTTNTPTVANFLATTPIFTIPAENDVFTSRFTSLAASAGQTIYIAFRNNSNDQFLLYIDNIEVVEQAAFDIELTDIEFSLYPGYTLMPVSQATGTDFFSSALVTNIGGQAVTNAELTVNIYDGQINLLNASAGTPLPSLPSGEDTVLTAPGFAPADTGTYFGEFIVNIDETDIDGSNDTLVNVVVVTDSTYARDNGQISGSLGIGAGPGQNSILGQNFDIYNMDDLTSVTFALNGPTLGDSIYVSIYDTDANGMPVSEIMVTESYVITPADTGSGVVLTLAPVIGAYSMMPGTYFIGVNETGGNVTLATTGLFTPGVGWVNWDSSPAGGWANNEDFNFNVSFVLRANFGPTECIDYSVNAVVEDDACEGGLGSINLNVGGGGGGTSYSWDNGATTQDLNGLSAGTYTVTISSNTFANCDTTLSFTVANQGAPINLTPVTDPNLGTATVTIVGGTAPYSFSWNTTPPTTDSVATGLAPGNYIVTVTDANGCQETSTVFLAVSIDDLLNAGISNMEIFPNPSEGRFNMNIELANMDDLSITVYDLNGRPVHTDARNNVTAYNEQFDLSNLAKGTYTIRVSTSQGTSFGRIVIR